MKTTKFAVLIDGTVLYHTSRFLFPERVLDYRALTSVLVQHIEGLTQPPSTQWVLWTAAAPDNTGQSRFLDFVEKTLGYQVRTFFPGDSYAVDPLGLGLDHERGYRLMRFDGSIAFALGRLAADSRVVLVTDAFALAEPLLRAAKISGASHALAFFGRGLDPRWQRIVRAGEKEKQIQFVDLDDFVDTLFGKQNGAKTRRDGYEDKFLI